LAIGLKLGSGGSLQQFQVGDSIEIDSVERRAGVGALSVGSLLGMGEELRLGSSASTVRSIGFFRVDSYLDLYDVTPVPANPGNGIGRLYKKTADDGLFWKPNVAGPEVDLTTAAAAQLLQINQSLTGVIDGMNMVFTSATVFKHTAALSEIFYINGIRQREGVGNDYVVSESVPAAGYDTITVEYAPLAGDVLSVDFYLF
jgi:hypothetical protein